jgi:hypothetical protein
MPPARMSRRARRGLPDGPDACIGGCSVVCFAAGIVVAIIPNQRRPFTARLFPVVFVLHFAAPAALIPASEKAVM